MIKGPAQQNYEERDELLVLHIGKYYPPFHGGMEVFLADLTSSLNSLSVRNIVLVHSHNEKPLWRKLSGICRQVLSGTKYISKMLADGKSVFRAETLVTLVYSPISPSFPFLLAKVCKAGSPDLLHIHMPNLSAFWLLVLPVCKSKRWIIHWQSDVVASSSDWKLRLLYPIYRFMERKLLAKADLVIATSPPYLETSIALKPWTHKCRVIPLGINSEIPKLSPDLESRANLAWGNAGLRVLSIGRLTYYKGMHFIVKAVRDLPEVTVLIVGEGTQRSNIEKLIKKHELSDRIQLLGNVSEHEKVAYLSSCDCLCLASFERTEAFGVVLLESMAQAKPMIVCNIPGSGVPWVVSHGNSGLVVDPNSDNSLREAMIHFSQNRSELIRMGQNGQKVREEKFNIDQTAKAIQIEYARVLGLNETDGKRT